jgi:hypothetical protein
MSTGYLNVKGTKIVDGGGNNVVLKAAATNGYLRLENFVTGYPGHEHEHKKALLDVSGKEKFDFFYEKFYEYFWTDKDAQFFASLNLNCLKVPFTYRHFIDDKNLSLIKTDEFKPLDKVLTVVQRHLHNFRSPFRWGQNQDWHCDGGIH